MQKSAISAQILKTGGISLFPKHVNIVSIKEKKIMRKTSYTL